MSTEALSLIGLTNWESKTYLALLELGSTTTGPLVKKAEVPQSKIYSVLESLNKKGLVSYIIKGKTKFFQANDPKTILTLFKEKEKEVSDLLIKLKQKQSLGKQSTELFEGIKSIKSLLVSLTDDLKKGEDWYGFSTGASYSKETDEFYLWWGARKKALGLKDHLLISAKNKKEFESRIEEEDLIPLKKILKYSKVSFPGDVAIFRDKVIIFNWEEPATAILIRSKTLSKEYKDFFLGLWEIAKP